MLNELLILAMISLAATLLLALVAACLQRMSRSLRHARLRPLALRALAGSVAPVLPAVAAITTFLYLDHVKPPPAVALLVGTNGQPSHVVVGHGNVALLLWEEHVRTATLLAGAFTLLTLIAVVALLLYDRGFLARRTSRS